MLTSAKPRSWRAVDQLLRGRRRCGQDAEPGEGIDPLEDAQHALRDRRPADAVEAVAAGDEVAVELAHLAVIAEADRGLVAVEVVQAHGLRLEQDLAAGRQPRGDQVLHHLVLAVDRDPAPAGRARRSRCGGRCRRSAARSRRWTRPSRCMRSPTPVSSGGRRALLQHAGADALLDMPARARLQHDGLDALQMQQMRQQQAGRPGSDDPDLDRPTQATSTG